MLDWEPGECDSPKEFIASIRRQTAKNLTKEMMERMSPYERKCGNPRHAAGILVCLTDAPFVRQNMEAIRRERLFNSGEYQQATKVPGSTPPNRGVDRQEVPDPGPLMPFKQCCGHDSVLCHQMPGYPKVRLMESLPGRPQKEIVAMQKHNRDRSIFDGYRFK